MRMRATFALAALVVGAASFAAGPAAKDQKIAQIIEAQGLHEMFQAQLDQNMASARQVGQNLVRKMAQEAAMSDAEAAAKLEPVFRRYMERCATMFSARELVEIWAEGYGRGLSDSDLDQILAFYKSPAGKKDVAATQAGMTAFAQKMNALGQARLGESVDQLMRDLKAAMRK